MLDLQPPTAVFLVTLERVHPTTIGGTSPAAFWIACGVSFVAGILAARSWRQ